MLDDRNILKQRDPNEALEQATNLYQALAWHPNIESSEHDGREIKNVVITGMGGSGLAAKMALTLTRPWLSVPFEVVQDYELPGNVGHNTLVIAISHSGNTEETLSAYAKALNKNSQVAVISTGGKLMERAVENNNTRTVIPSGMQPRMATYYHLRVILKYLELFGLSGDHLYNEMTDSAEWIRSESARWHPDVPVQENYAKQIALMTVGKTPVFYSGPLLESVAYKWKINWNEFAKNVAFTGKYPEFNHNEFIGWSSHPIEKPFAVIDLWSDLENDRINERMELSDRLLSGLRPKAIRLYMQGDTLLKQMLWSLNLAELSSIYTAIINNVEPVAVELVERLKTDLSPREY